MVERELVKYFHYSIQVNLNVVGTVEILLTVECRVDMWMWEYMKH